MCSYREKSEIDSLLKQVIYNKSLQEKEIDLKNLIFCGQKIDLLKGRIKIEHSYCKSEMTKPVKTASRSKRKLTDDQRNELELMLKETPYPRRNKMEELAQKMGVSFHNINLWLRKIRRSNLNKFKSSSSHDYHEKSSSGSD